MSLVVELTQQVKNYIKKIDFIVCCSSKKTRHSTILFQPNYKNLNITKIQVKADPNQSLLDPGAPPPTLPGDWDCSLVGFTVDSTVKGADNWLKHF